MFLIFTSMMVDLLIFKRTSPFGRGTSEKISLIFQTVTMATIEVGRVDLYSPLPSQLIWTDEPRPRYKPWSFVLLSSFWQSSSLVCCVLIKPAVGLWSVELWVLFPNLYFYTARTSCVGITMFNFSLHILYHTFTQIASK